MIAITSTYWCSAAVFDVPITIGTHPILDNVNQSTASALSEEEVLLNATIDGDAPSPPNSPPPEFPNDGKFLHDYKRM